MTSPSRRIHRPKPEKGHHTLVARTFSKPQEARELVVRVEVVSEARQYRTRSQSQPGEVYTLTRPPAGWACGCQGYYYTGCCKHLGQLQRRAERDGWAFGAIAPLSTVARYFPLDEPDPEPPAPAAHQPRERAHQALALVYGSAD